MKPKSIALYIICLAVIVSFIPAAAWAQKVYIIKTAHGAGVNSVRHLTYENFKQLCEKYSHGRLKVEIFPAGSLYTDAQTLQACMIGSIQMVFQPDAEVAKILPIGNLIGGPGLYNSLDSFYKFARSPEMMELLKPLKAKGLQPLGHDLNSMGYIFMSNVRAIRVPKDLAGVKIRSWPAEFPRMMIKAVGGIPVVVNLSEITTALQEGAVQGVFTSCITGYASKLNQLTKYYCTGMLLGPSPNIAVFNKAFWDSLPKDLREIISNKVWPENQAYNEKLVVKAENKARDGYRATGDLYVLDGAPNQEIWRKAVLPVRDYFAHQVGADEWNLVKKGLGLQ